MTIEHMPRSNIELFFLDEMLVPYDTSSAIYLITI